MFHSYRTRQPSYNTDESLNNSLERTQSDLDSLEYNNLKPNILSYENSQEEIQTDLDKIAQTEDNKISINSAVEFIDKMYAEIIANKNIEKKFLSVLTQTSRILSTQTDRKL